MRYIVLVLLLFVAGCGSVGTYAPSPNSSLAHNPQAPLFAADKALISDVEIARILDTEIQLPATFRIGLVYLSHERVQDGRSTGYLRKYDWPLVNEAFNVLQENEKVYDVSYLPQLLLPKQVSAGNLRSAAARYQADWIFVFQTSTQIITRNPLLSVNKARAYCQAECMVLDVRTGLIAFSSRSRISITKEENDEEWSLAETVGRTEQEAIEEAMSLNVKKLVSYIDNLKG